MHLNFMPNEKVEFNYDVTRTVSITQDAAKLLFEKFREFHKDESIPSIEYGWYEFDTHTEKQMYVKILNCAECSNGYESDFTYLITDVPESKWTPEPVTQLPREITGASETHNVIIFDYSQLAFENRELLTIIVNPNEWLLSEIVIDKMTKDDIDRIIINYIVDYADIKDVCL